MFGTDRRNPKLLRIEGGRGIADDPEAQMEAFFKIYDDFVSGFTEEKEKQEFIERMDSLIEGKDNVGQILLSARLEDLQFEVESNWDKEDITAIMKELAETGYIEIPKDVYD